MTTYTEVFGSTTIPPSPNRYVAVALAADTTFYWPEQATGTNLIADITEVTPSAAYAMTFPDATVVSTGRSVLLRNIGNFTVTLKDSSGGGIGTVESGVAKYVYLTDNSTAAGLWTIFTFGAGTSAADAAALAGYGLTATGSTLSQSTSTVSSSISTTLIAADRASLRIFSASGAVTCSLPTAVGLGDGWFACISNQGSGTVTIDPNSTETIDGALTKDIAPGESTYIVTDGANWVTVGYGRSTQFQFTKLVYPIAVGTPFTLTSVQAENKLLEFTGILTAAATVNVPAVVAIYYVECSYTGAYALTIKTAAGTGVNLNAGDRSILYCDGTNVTSAQTASVAVSNISGGVAGALPYQSGVGLTGFSSAGSSGQILVSGGTGAPVFGAAATAPAGLTVSGAAFTSRGITDNATATALTIDSAGKVYAGNTTALAGQTLLGILQSTDTGAGLNLALRKSVTSTNGANLGLLKSRGTAAAPSVIVTGDVIGSCVGYGFDGTNYTQGFAITGTSEGTIGVGAIPCSVLIKTASSAGTMTEAFRIDSTQAVTLGGTSTAPALKVIPGGGNVNWVTITGSATTPAIGTSAGDLLFTSAAGDIHLKLGTSLTNPVNYLKVSGSSATTPSIIADGSGTDINIAIMTKGAGYMRLMGDAYEQVRIVNTASADRYISLTGSSGGNPKVTTSAGSLDIGAAIVLTGQTVGSTIGAAGGASALPATPLGYVTTSINGTACKIPYYNP